MNITLGRAWTVWGWSFVAIVGAAAIAVTTTAQTPAAHFVSVAITLIGIGMATRSV